MSGTNPIPDWPAALAPDEPPSDQAQPYSPRALAFQRLAPHVVAALSLVLGLGVLLGGALEGILPHLSSMKPSTATGFIISGAAVWLAAVSNARHHWARPAVIAGLLTGAIGVMTFGEYALGRDFLAAPLWRDSTGTRGMLVAGRMSLNAALAFILLSAALLGKLRATPRAQWQSDGSGVAVMIVALVPLVGYLYGTGHVLGIAPGLQMALPTAVVFLILPVGVAAIPPHGPIMALAMSSGPGGIVVRRLLPAYSVALILSGWLPLLGETAGLYGLDLGLGEMVAANVALFGAATGWTALAIDKSVLQQRRAEAALRESELRYRSIVNATFDGIVVTEDRVIREANAGLAAMFGYDLEELIGRPVMDLIAEESRDFVEEGMRTGREGVYEAAGRRKDGRRIDFEAVVKVHGGKARPARLAALRDITTQRKLEIQLRQAQKMEAIGQLAGGVSHDFNNLLTVIVSYTHILLQEMGPGDSRREPLEQIRLAAESAAGLTRQLLAFSRQQVLEPQPLVLNAVVEKQEKLLRRLIGEDVVLRIVLAPDLRPTVADFGQIEQIIINLAVNSRDAMPAGGTLTIETANVELDASSTTGAGVMHPGSHVLLALSDTGVGMDEETRQRVFEPFFTTKAPGKGTGLGLATVYGIVKQSGGYIWVYSEPGEGTTFKIYFPATDQPVGAESGHAVALPVARGTETVLLVEDAAAVRALARDALQRNGYTVLDAASGAAALETAAAYQGPIHLLVSDVVMGGMSGRLLADQLTARRPGLKVLFVSGYTRDVVMQHGILGATAQLLPKPFTPDVLARKVRAVLDAP